MTAATEPMHLRRCMRARRNKNLIKRPGKKEAGSPYDSISCVGSWGYVIMANHSTPFYDGFHFRALLQRRRLRLTVLASSPHCQWDRHKVANRLTFPLNVSGLFKKKILCSCLCISTIHLRFCFSNIHLVMSVAILSVPPLGRHFFCAIIQNGELLTTRPILFVSYIA